LTYPKKKTNQNANDGSYILLDSKELNKKQSKKKYTMMKASTLSHKNTKNGKLMYKQCSQQWTKQKQDDKSKMIGKDAWKLER
jgi:hypothetical protein